VSLVLCGPILGSKVDKSIPQVNRGFGVLDQVALSVEQRSADAPQEGVELLEGGYTAPRVIAQTSAMVRRHSSERGVMYPSGSGA
jgi:hypothetical protein